MSINYALPPDSTHVFDLLTQSNITPTLQTSDDLFQLRIDAAVREIQQRTKRQFVPGSPGETRFYDGTGTGELVVDEYIAITEIDFYLVPELATIQDLTFFVIQRNQYPATRIQIFQGPANLPVGWYTRFPQGRSNIGVIGTWGYSANIPPDVWQAMLFRAAGLIADADRIGPVSVTAIKAVGALTSIRDDDVTLQFTSEQISIVAGWKQEVDRVCKQYKRPLKETLRRSRPTLI